MHNIIGQHTSRSRAQPRKNIDVFGADVDDLFKGDVEVAAVVLGAKQLDLMHIMDAPHLAF
jgi:hypothetical protein